MDAILAPSAEDLLTAMRGMRTKTCGPDDWEAEALLAMPLYWWEALSRTPATGDIPPCKGQGGGNIGGLPERSIIDAHIRLAAFFSDEDDGMQGLSKFFSSMTEEPGCGRLASPPGP